MSNVFGAHRVWSGEELSRERLIEEGVGGPFPEAAGRYGTPEWRAMRDLRKNPNGLVPAVDRRWAYSKVIADLKVQRDGLNVAIAALEEIARGFDPPSDNADAPALPRTLPATEPQTDEN